MPEQKRKKAAETKSVKSSSSSSSSSTTTAGKASKKARSEEAKEGNKSNMLVTITLPFIPFTCIIPYNDLTYSLDSLFFNQLLSNLFYFMCHREDEGVVYFVL